MSTARPLLIVAFHEKASPVKPLMSPFPAVAVATSFLLSPFGGTTRLPFALSVTSLLWRSVHAEVHGCRVLQSCYRPLCGRVQRLFAVTQTRGSSVIACLRCLRVLASQRLIRFAGHPQPVQEDG